MEHLGLDVLRTFVSIIELKGFNKAAEKVHLSQSAISMQIKKLEELTGQALFERKGKHHLLTHQGELLLSYAKKMLDLNDEALQLLQQTKLKGRIRVGIQLDFASSPLPSSLYRFVKMHPELLLDLKVDASDALQHQLSEGKLDIILFLGNDKTTSFDAHMLGSHPLKWFYSPSTRPTFDGSPLPLVALGPNCKIRQLSSAALNEAGIPWKILFTSSSLQAVWGAVSAGIGIFARTTIGAPAQLKTVPRSAGLPDLPTVNTWLCTASGEDRRAILQLRDFIRQAP